MAVLKCKMCGGSLRTAGNEKVIECEYCGSTQTIPDAANEKKVNLFNRANRLRLDCDFDKAAGIYETVLAEFPNESEAYWGLCLCNYGIEYVDDPATARKVPTCHRASYKKLINDANYSLTVKNADEKAKTVYRNQAQEIDRIMCDILAISQQEKPYDVFICYKETDDNGDRTPDSVLAQDIYDALQAKNYRVFFSRISLEDKLGTQYEPYIFSALNSAKVMLVVGTDSEYFNSVWVKNEWSRFLHMTESDKSKVVVPCYKNISPYDIPNELKNFQAQDCSKLGFMQDLVRGIDKLIGVSQSKSNQESTELSGGQMAGLILRAYIYLEDGNWDSADEYCERVLDIDPTCVKAYVGKLMAKYKVSKFEELSDLSCSLENEDAFVKAMRFGDDSTRSELEAINGAILGRLAIQADNAQKDTIYSTALNLLAIGDNESISQAVSQLKAIPGWKKSNELVNNYELWLDISQKYSEYLEVYPAAKDATDYAERKELLQSVLYDTVIWKKEFPTIGKVTLAIAVAGILLGWTGLALVSLVVFFSIYFLAVIKKRATILQMLEECNALQNSVETVPSFIAYAPEFSDHVDKVNKYISGLCISKPEKDYISEKLKTESDPRVQKAQMNYNAAVAALTSFEAACQREQNELTTRMMHLRAELNSLKPLQVSKKMSTQAEITKVSARLEKLGTRHKVEGAKLQEVKRKAQELLNKKQAEAKKHISQMKQEMQKTENGVKLLQKDDMRNEVVARMNINKNGVKIFKNLPKTILSAYS